MASKRFSDLSPAQQGLLLALLPVALAVVVFYNFVMPLTGQASQLQSQVASLHTQNMRGRMLEAERVQLQKRIAQAQQEIAALREIVPDQPAHDQFVRMLYDTAQASSVHIRDLQAAPSAKQTYFTEMPFHAHLDGAYYAMLDFFKRLAGSARIVNVSGLSLASVNSSGSSGAYKTGPQETVAASCTLTTFYNSPPPGSRSGEGGGQTMKKMKKSARKSEARRWQQWSAVVAAVLCAGLAQAVQPVSAARKNDRPIPKASAQVTGPVLDGPALTQPEPAAAHGLATLEGKRDPFKLPPPPTPASALDMKIERPANLPPGPHGLIVADLKLEGVVSEDSGREMIAVVTAGGRDRAYFLSENEELYDGQVTRITPGAVYFTEKFFDRQGREAVRPVVKSLASGAGEGR